MTRPRHDLAAIRRWLQKRGYDGLAGEDCGCGIDDLAACGESPDLCVPATCVVAEQDDLDQFDCRVGEPLYVAGRCPRGRQRKAVG